MLSFFFRYVGRDVTCATELICILSCVLVNIKVLDDILLLLSFTIYFSVSNCILF
jgi:hypothetical protein